jgi:aryl-alcohol dehydrogenase-like predicted oxidoreductase
VIVGVSRPSQWDENAASLQVALSPEDYQRLDAAGMEVWSRFRPEDTMWGWKPT